MACTGQQAPVAQTSILGDRDVPDWVVRPGWGSRGGGVCAVPRRDGFSAPPGQGEFNAFPGQIDNICSRRLPGPVIRCLIAFAFLGVI